MSARRVGLARAVIAAGAKLQSLALLVMRPDDLIEFSRQAYAGPLVVQDWGRPDLVAEGLYPNEEALLARCPVRSGRVLVLDVGGGREAIPLARQGFEVTGVDFVPEMVSLAVSNAAAQGVALDGLVQEISQLDVPPGLYDLVWISSRMYSSVPTRARRVAMLERVRGALRPGGCFVAMFDWDPTQRATWRGVALRRFVALATLGHVGYEPGDKLLHNAEFIHTFGDERALREEFEAGGLNVLHLDLPEGGHGGAVLQKPASAAAAQPAKESEQ